MTIYFSAFVRGKIDIYLVNPHVLASVMQKYAEADPEKIGCSSVER